MRRDYKSLLAYLLLMTGILMSIWITWAIAKGYLSKDWPATKALIYQSEIVQAISGLDKNYYSVHLSYQYKIDKMQYTNSQIYLTDLPFLSLQEAEHLLAKYKPGSIHPLRYNPNMPEESALIPGISNTLIILLAPSVLFVGIGLGARRKKHRKPKRA